MEMSINKDVSEWAEVFVNMDVLSYELTFGALIGSVLAVMLSKDLTTTIITFLADLALDDTNADFLKN